jgi:hypothetical protein
MRHEITIICDDIRQESGRKISLMGMYDEAVVVKQIPVRLAKICIFQRWADSNLKPGEKVRLEVVGNAIPGPVAIECQADPEHFSRAATKAQILVALAPFDILKGGEIEFLTYLPDSEEVAHRHKLEVRIDPDLAL